MPLVATESAEIDLPSHTNSLGHQHFPVDAILMRYQFNS